MPASGALRPLVVVDVHEKSTADPGYQATADDVKAWEAEHGPVPEGSVVMFRSDWYKNWDDLENFAKAPFPGVRLARRSVVEGKSVSVRVDLGGRRSIKKKRRTRTPATKD